MNILFHTTAAIGLIATLNSTQDKELSTAKMITVGIVSFAIGVVSHGALDYIPHCYPINSKVDIILGALIIGVLTLMSRPRYRLIVGLTFIGCIFPDLIDLSPQILNKYIGTSLPIQDKVFPWHWERYSGSIFTDDCRTSALNHSLLLLVVAAVCILNKESLLHLFQIKKPL